MSTVRRVVGLLFVLGCDTAEDRPATWSYLHAAIIAPSCATASCHSSLASVAGRDLSTPEYAYAALTGRTCNAPPHPQDPPLEYTRYVFIQSLYGFGQRGIEPDGPYDLLMPPDQPLADVEIDLIERWYAAGAKCD